MKTSHQKHLGVAHILAATFILAASQPAMAGDHGNNTSTNSNIGSGDHLGRIDHSGDEDWFRFRPALHGPASLRILPENNQAAVTPRDLVLRDAAGQIIEQRRYGSNAYIDFAVRAGVTYYACVSKGTVGTRYRLRLLLPQDGRVFSPNLLNGEIRCPNDVELFKFSVGVPGHATVNTRPVSPASAPIQHKLALLDENGKQLNFYYGTKHDGFLNPGTYYVRTLWYGSNSGSIGRFGIELNHNQNAASLKRGTNTINFEVVQDIDYLRFDIPGPRSKKVTITPGSQFGGVMEIYNNSGSQIAIRYGNRPITLTTLSPGRYYLKIHNSGKIGNARVTLDF